MRYLRVVAAILAVTGLVTLAWGVLAGPVRLMVQNVREIATGLDAPEAPAVDGDLIAFRARPTASALADEIFVEDLRSGTLFRLTENGIPKGPPDIDASRVVWTERNGAVTRAFLHSLSDGTTEEISFASSSIHSIQLSGDMAVWVGQEPQPPPSRVLNSLFLYDLAQRSGTQLRPPVADHNSPRIHQGRVVWDDDREWVSNPDARTDVYLYDSRNAVEAQVTSGSASEGSADAYGEIVVWTDWGTRLGEAEIFWRDFRSGVEKRLTQNAYDDILPRLSGKLVAWIGAPDTTEDVFAADLEIGDVIRVTEGPERETSVALAGGHIAWVSYDANLSSSILVGEIVRVRELWPPAVSGTMFLSGMLLAALGRRRASNNSIEGRKVP